MLADNFSGAEGEEKSERKTSHDHRRCLRARSSIARPRVARRAPCGCRSRACVARPSRLSLRRCRRRQALAQARQRSENNAAPARTNQSCGLPSMWLVEGSQFENRQQRIDALHGAAKQIRGGGFVRWREARRISQRRKRSFLKAARERQVNAAIHATLSNSRFLVVGTMPMISIGVPRLISPRVTVDVAVGHVEHRKLNLLPERVTVRPQFFREHFIDDRHRQVRPVAWLPLR